MLDLHLAVGLFRWAPCKTNRIQEDFSISHYQFFTDIKICGLLQNQGSRFCWAIVPQDHCVRATVTVDFMGYDMKWQQIYIHVIIMPCTDWYWSDCICQLQWSENLCLEKYFIIASVCSSQCLSFWYLNENEKSMSSRLQKFIEDEPNQACIFEVSIHWHLTFPVFKYQLKEKLPISFGLHSDFLTAHWITSYFKRSPSSQGGTY